MSIRSRFFLIHLCISSVVGILVALFIFNIWYPAPLAKATGVTKLFMMMLIIDVIIGPIMTFIVYKVGKKTLKFDLAVIICLQLCALSYGIYSMAQGRPAWIVYNGKEFVLVRKNEQISDSDLHLNNNTDLKYQKVSLLGPKYVGIMYASDEEGLKRDILEETVGKISIAQKPSRYIDLNAAKYQNPLTPYNLRDLKKYNNSKEVDRVLGRYSNLDGYLPLKANHMDMTVLIKSDEVVDIIDLRPW